MLRTALFVLTFTVICYAQTDWEYWKASAPSYVPENQNSVKQDKSEKLTDRLFSGARSVYKFLISDLDGDNCPFHPTCSEFFVESAHKTNIIKSVLMFADRFTRDINISKGPGQYLLSPDRRFYDPVDNYLLDPGKIYQIPLRAE